MTEENAALTDEAFDAQIEAAQVEPEQADATVEPTESAPVDAEAPQEEDGFQKRINKVTADKYAEKRRADELQRKLDEVSKPVDVASTLKLEDYDYDDAAYNAALIKAQVAEAVQAERQEHARQAQDQQERQAVAAFNERVAALEKPDFAELMDKIQLPDGVAAALVQSESGAELVYHLGQHLDQADRIAGMTPQLAMLELGKISANLTAKPNIKLSAAPDPIEPITSGGSLNKDISELSMEELYNL